MLRVAYFALSPGELRLILCMMCVLRCALHYLRCNLFCLRCALCCVVFGGALCVSFRVAFRAVSHCVVFCIELPCAVCGGRVLVGLFAHHIYCVNIRSLTFVSWHPCVFSCWHHET